MFPIINIGPLAIQAPELLLVIGIYFSILLAEKTATSFDENPNQISNLVFIYFVSTIILGRIAYILRFSALFIEKPLSIISIDKNLFDFNSGLILSITVAVIYIQKKKLVLFKVMDALAIPLLSFLLFFFLAQYASGNLYGKPSDLRWSIYLWGMQRHPLPIYYMIGVATILVWAFRFFKNKYSPGVFFTITLASLSILTVFLDYFNGNPQNLFQGINILQVIAWVVLFFCLYIIYDKIGKTKPENFSG